MSKVGNPLYGARTPLVRAAAQPERSARERLRELVPYLDRLLMDTSQHWPLFVLDVLSDAGFLTSWEQLIPVGQQEPEDGWPPRVLVRVCETDDADFAFLIERPLERKFDLVFAH